MADQKKILVVDDTPENIEVLVGCLRDSYRIQAARDGETALKIAGSARPPDLILLDIMMPGMDGYEVCRRLKSAPATRDIPVIFVSALSETGDETHGLELGAADYITKPISPPIVQARVRTQLTLREAMRDLQTAYDEIEGQKRRMQSELDIGREIQLSMVPSSFPQRAECDVHARLVPAREVGGDFYDCFMIGRQKLCICIGDVSDKGVPSALLMAVTKTMIRVRADADDSPAAILDYVNRAMREGNDACMFVTLFLAILDLGTGELVSCNAGHNPPLVRGRDGGVRRLSRRDGPVVGFPLSVGGYTEGRTALYAGDTLILYTDGVTEAQSKAEEMFGVQRLERLLAGSQAGSMEAQVSEIVDAAAAFEQGRAQTDDICVLGLRFLGAGTGPRERLEVSIRNDRAGIVEVNRRFEQFASDRGIREPDRDKVLIALDELLQNVVSYAYEDSADHRIEVSVHHQPDCLRLEVRDDGRPFNPFALAPPDTDEPVLERSEGGFGIHLLRRLFDRTDYLREGGRNRVRLELRLSGDGAE